MHIPDGFLNHGAATGMAGAAALAVGWAVSKVRKAFLEKVPVLRRKLATFPSVNGGAEASFQHRFSRVGQEKIQRMAAVGSLIFAAQMVNFPIGGGTSGHLLGGVLVALILGPFEALLVMAVILSTQALLFGDGGVLALGANIFNMGVVGALGGYAFFRFLVGGTTQKKVFLQSAFVAAWVSVIASAMAASVEIAVSGTQGLLAILPAMTLMYMMIGLGEGALTAVILLVLLRRGYALAAFEKEESYES